MAHIIAARLQEQDQIANAVAALKDAGFNEASISSFYVNPPGQHDLFPLGGDREASPGAKEAAVGVVAGAGAGGLVGAAVGALTIPVAGPVGVVGGTLLGTYIGSLVGGLSEMKEKGESEAGGENSNAPRTSGMLVAVSVTDETSEARAVSVLQRAGGQQLELAKGHIENGDWKDFDPLEPPNFLEAPQ